MLLVGECWRRTVKVAVLLLLAAELKLLDARPSRYLLRRHGSSAGGPRSAAVTDHDTATADSAPRRPWLTPCAGSTIAETETEAVRLEDSVDASTSSSSSSSSSSVGVDDLTTRHGRRRSLRRLARHMARLADRVDRLKQRYVSVCTHLRFNQIVLYALAWRDRKGIRPVKKLQGCWFVGGDDLTGALHVS